MLNFLERRLKPDTFEKRCCKVNCTQPIFHTASGWGNQAACELNHRRILLDADLR